MSTPQSTGLSIEQIKALGTVTNIVTAGQALGMSKNTAYRLAAAGDFPCPVIRVRSTYRVPVAGILRALGIDPGHD